MGLPYAEVIGDPVAHSRSPLIHSFWLEKLGLAGAYRATRVTPPTLPAYLESRRADPDWRGCNVTMPLKEAVVPHLESLSEEAHGIGAVNAVCRDSSGGLCGLNTDVEGVRRSLVGLVPPSPHILLLGAGGAARAAAWALRSHAPRMTVINRDAARAERLLGDLGLQGSAGSDWQAGAHDLVINTVPRLPALDIAGLPNHAVVMDMIYDPPETDLLVAARGRGLVVVDGLTMLANQAASAFALFFGGAAPESGGALRELLTP